MKIKIGYLGRDASTFGHMAAKRYFENSNSDFEIIGCGTHMEICEKVGRMYLDYGVVAIENVLDGVVSETARAIEKIDSQLGLKINGEVILPIQLYVVNKTGNQADIEKLLSHPSALGQCSFYVSMLEAQGIVIESTKSTAEAAKKSFKDNACAALVSREALDQFGLKLIEKNPVVNHERSATRFWIIGKKHAYRTGNDKTCFLVNLERLQKGALSHTLGVFADNEVNILLIYPISIFGKCWEYTFFIEVCGHIDDEPIIKAWNQFNKLGISFRSLHFLGSYPKSNI